MFYSVEMRNEYKFNLKINNKRISKVIIDQHYLKKHSEHMTDSLVLEIIKTLDGHYFFPITEDTEYQYFRVEPVLYNAKPYRLIFLLYIHEATLGIINCFRVNRR
jgi:hypothetical protein